LLLTVDASTLVGELLRRRGQKLFSTDELEFYVPSRMWDETEHELRRRLGIMVSQGRADEGIVERYLWRAVRVKEERITEVPEPVYEHLEGEALARLPRDSGDWQVVALALLSGSDILTNDRDFFGCGVATWTVETLMIHVERMGL
jgi:predicted nucleic acid-binding protein